MGSRVGRWGKWANESTSLAKYAENDDNGDKEDAAGVFIHAVDSPAPRVAAVA